MKKRKQEKFRKTFLRITDSEFEHFLMDKKTREREGEGEQERREKL